MFIYPFAIRIKMQPKVSVIMSVKNGEKFLSKTIESILSQSLSDFEFLVADDMSTDGTAALLCKYAAEDKRIRIVVNYSNSGLTRSLNRLLESAEGEFIARIDADDTARNDRLERQAAVLGGGEGMVMVASCYRAINDEGMQLYSHCPSSNPISLKWSLIFRNNIRHSTVMWKRKLGLKYDEQYAYSQDYDMWCRMARLGEIGVIPEPLGDIRSHGGAITLEKRKEQDEAAAKITAGQFLHYTGKKITKEESEGLRLMHHLKDGIQFQQLEQMSPEDIKKSAMLYLDVLHCFCRSEKILQDEMISEAKTDLDSLTNLETAKAKVLEAVREWRSINDGLEKITATF